MQEFHTMLKFALRRMKSHPQVSLRIALFELSKVPFLLPGFTLHATGRLQANA